jgi:hypothetical protein
MYKTDILIIIYPNFNEIKSIILIDPFDKKVEMYDADSIDEAKDLLKQHLPFCSQGHTSDLHLGDAYIIEWKTLPSTQLIIKKPEDVDVVMNFRGNMDE